MSEIERCGAIWRRTPRHGHNDGHAKGNLSRGNWDQVDDLSFRNAVAAEEVEAKEQLMTKECTSYRLVLADRDESLVDLGFLVS